jgi:hypothetical protein
VIFVKMYKMILLAMVYGDKYINSFFDRCLPSLMTQNNLPAIAPEPLTLFICTLESSLSTVRQRFRSSEFRSIFENRVGFHSIPFEPNEADSPVERVQRQRKVTYSLLVRGMRFCLDRGETFLMVSPDVMYADGTVQSNWELHRLTGKVVANFNGRMAPIDGGSEYYLEMMKRQFGVKEMFFAHSEERWLDLITSEPDYLPGAEQGQQVFKGPRVVHIFGNANPLMGKFQPEDYIFFLKTGLFNSWDHEWLDFLERKQRILVQTNLDVGMSVEPWDGGTREFAHEMAKTRNALRSITERQEHFVGKDPGNIDVLEEERKFRFGGQLSNFCFSTLLPESWRS